MIDNVVLAIKKKHTPSHRALGLPVDSLQLNKLDLAYSVEALCDGHGDLVSRCLPENEFSSESRTEDTTTGKRNT